MSLVAAAEIKHLRIMNFFCFAQGVQNLELLIENIFQVRVQFFVHLILLLAYFIREIISWRIAALKYDEHTAASIVWTTFMSLQSHASFLIF